LKGDLPSASVRVAMLFVSPSVMRPLGAGPAEDTSPLTGESVRPRAISPWAARLGDPGPGRTTGKHDRGTHALTTYTRQNRMGTLFEDITGVGCEGGQVPSVAVEPALQICNSQ
jgi:hypothetical protein